MLSKRKRDLEQTLPNKQLHTSSAQTDSNAAEIDKLIPIPDYALQNFWSDPQELGSKLASFMIENSGSMEKELSELKAENAFLKEMMQLQTAGRAVITSEQMELKAKDKQIAKLQQIIGNQAYQLKLYRERLGELQRQNEILRQMTEQRFEYGQQPRIAPAPLPLPSRNFNFGIWHPLVRQPVSATNQAAHLPNTNPALKGFLK